jgi:hypothetical protein
MDELIFKDELNRPELTVVPLNNKHEISLLRAFEVDIKTQKKYMRNVVFMIQNEFITDNMADSVLLKEELILFEKGDEQNTFFQLKSRKIKESNVLSLSSTLDSGKVIYISKSQARAIVSLWNMAMMGYSFARILEFETQQTLQSWTQALYDNYLLELDNK